ncbi:hypothetical protein KM043_018656 [Ampulex compressa]|nr:hypothetical protein KM043_018656 [Ampulex compressa]
MLLLSALFLALSGMSLAHERTPVIKTDKGFVFGVQLKTVWHSKVFSSFKGIPYAEPPIGKNRFKPPVPAKAWWDVLSADADGNECPQLAGNAVVGDEDCLFINVYTPELEFKKNMNLRPVMVWIYGGAFVSGNNNISVYGPDFFMEEDVVVVTLNYRLGALGFLTLDHPDALGNAGLKDQVLALKWVQTNIANFGGDPNKVTIFGESAGAASVDFLTLSDMATGLFHQSIAQSGVALCPWSFYTPDVGVRRAFRLGKILGYNTKDKDELLNFLLTAPIEGLVTSILKFDEVDLPFKPTLENSKLAPKNEIFISECSVKKFESGNYNKHPRLMGYNKNEVLSFFKAADDVLKWISYGKFFTDSIDNMTIAKPPGWTEWTAPLRQPHFVENLPPLLRDTVEKVLTDLLFIAEIDLTQRLMSFNNDWPIYMYRLSYESQYALHNLSSGVDLPGTGHADDVGYLFNIQSLNVPTDPNDPFNIFRKKMVRLWTNFAKYGDPTPSGWNDPLLGVSWPDSRLFGLELDINTDLTVHPRLVDLETRLYEGVIFAFGRLYSGCWHFVRQPVGRRKLVWQVLTEASEIGKGSLFSRRRTTILFKVFAANGGIADFTPNVQTTKGLVRGTIEVTIWNLTYYSFRGIPYATPPLGNLRFKPPLEAKAWDGVYDATKDGSECTQMDGDVVKGSEDCLTLNVFTSELQPKRPMSVMVWIYGGAFSGGSSNSTIYGPDLLLNENIILVSLNYRLGALGFLALDHPAAVGNAGLKDQLLALKWVRANIANFGGNPESVTIFGNSAGGASVAFHVLSPRSKGLFHAAIGESASPFCPWAFSNREEALRNAVQVGKYLDCKAHDINALLKCLLNAPAKDIIIATEKFQQLDIVFKPTLEDPKIVPRDEIFLQECFIEQYITGRYNRVPYMLGFAKDETITFITDAQNELNKLVDYAIKVINKLNLTHSGDPLCGELCVQEIKNDTIIENFPPELRDTFVNATSDLFFKSEVDFQQRCMILHMRDVYFYQTSYETEYSSHKYIHGVDLKGVGHGDENGYVLQLNGFNFPTDPNDSFNIFRRRMTRLWANFAKFRNPTPLGKKDSFLNVSWPVSGRAGLQMDLNNEFTVHPRLIDLQGRFYETIIQAIVREYTGCETPTDLIKKIIDFALPLVPILRFYPRCPELVRAADYFSDEMSAFTPELTVRRPVYQQDELNQLCKYVKPRRAFLKEISTKCKNIKPVSCLKKTIPLIDWLSSYDWKNHILGDIVAGITVAVMHIPQGMAYAILGNVPPIVGLYMAFFPVLVYLFLGTSRHNSMGTFALICMMTGKVVVTYSSAEEATKNGTMGLDVSSVAAAVHYTPIEVATAVTMTVAFIQLGMYVMRLGVIASLLSDSLVSGFTTAAAVHVFTSQVKDLFGLNNLPKRGGALKLILTYVDVFNNIEHINGAAVVLSAVTAIILIVNNELLKSRVAKVSPFPIPIEMLVVVIGTVLSIQMKLSEVYSIVTVGDIPVGLPVPSVPPLALIPNILMDSFVITMVSYTISISMALIFAQKNGYDVDSNQELAAQGFGNFVGSFFSCMPFTASLSRSLIQETVGGHTQLASLISCGILLSVMLWIGPFFEPLPRCILASIIVVALKGMLMKVTELRKFWKLDKVDACIWALTFLVVILSDVEYGLLVGVILCLAKLVLLATRPYICKLALAPGTEIYLDANRFKGTVEIPGIKILHYSGSLNFACKQQFRSEVYKVTEIVPQKILNRRAKATDKQEGNQDTKMLSVLILDFTALFHVDLTGATTIRNIVTEYCDLEILVYIAGCSGPVYETMRKCGLLECEQSRFFAIFPTVADAVHFARCSNEVPNVPTWTFCVRDENCISRL